MTTYSQQASGFQTKAIMNSFKLMVDVFILAIAVIWPVVHSGK